MRWRSRFLFAAIVPLFAACGARSHLHDDETSFATPGDDGGPASACGDGVCAPSLAETCTTCPLDCGLCPTCPNGTCDETESCASCPADCGGCDTCGDGYCKGAEDCLSCAPDCGKCPSCGDGACDTATETCFTCPDDCGKCEGCGDGLCKADKENCVSCPHDCGVCSVCGNGKCEQYESCSNCQADCGECQTLGCQQVFTCALKCVDLKKKPPDFSVSCVANCLSLGCADTQFFFDQAFKCAIFALPQCGGDFGCLQKQCDAEIAACFGATCVQPGH